MKKIILWVIVAGALAVGGYYLSQQDGGAKPQEATNASSTTETVNESTVNDSIKNWQKSIGDGLSFSYPGELGTVYVGAKLWPPQAFLLGAGPLTCAAAGTETGVNGVTASKVIAGHTYCITKKSEGTAGTTYTQYAYAFEKDKKIIALLFNLRYVNCGNYEAPKKAECEAERKTFNIDTIADKIAQSVTLSKIEEAPTKIVIPAGQ